MASNQKEAFRSADGHNAVFSSSFSIPPSYTNPPNDDYQSRNKSRSNNPPNYSLHGQASPFSTSLYQQIQSHDTNTPNDESQSRNKSRNYNIPNYSLRGQTSLFSALPNQQIQYYDTNTPNDDYQSRNKSRNNNPPNYSLHGQASSFSAPPYKQLQSYEMTRMPPPSYVASAPTPNDDYQSRNKSRNNNPPNYSLRGQASSFSAPPYQQIQSYEMTRMPPPSYAAPAPRVPPHYAQQSRVLVVGGQRVTSPVVVEQSLRVSLIEAIVLSCIVTWFCGFLFGAIGFFFARSGQCLAEVGDRKEAIRLRNVSYCMSSAGFIIGCIAIGITVFVFLCLKGISRY